ncbi:unnamed protein product [Prorocentrum cordatum]|uniref:Uncharacterized protein n=1 Tax=Prorocentrum cordatum TaxID=2364126 RepID=A0ABN9UPD3_9DINO|nr:unnamed protein product [Polarella glacialis]
MTSGSSFTSHISLSSASASCHCSAFSHALIPAIVANEVALQLRLQDLPHQHQRPLPLLALSARADPSIVAMTSGSSFVSRISLSSASACCHCSPFSHALIPALWL